MSLKSPNDPYQFAVDVCSLGSLGSCNEEQRRETHEESVRRYKEEWCDTTERQMDLWMKKSERRAILHQSKSNKLNLFKHFFTLPPIVISSTLGMLNGISEERYKEVNIILSFSITCISAVSLKFNFEKRSMEHAAASQRFLYLTETINSQMAKERIHRRDVADFYCDVKHQYLHLVKTSPSINIEKVEDDID